MLSKGKSERSGLEIILPVLANEILDEIIHLLPTGDQASLIRMCWGLHCVVARQLYRHVAVWDHRALKFFKSVTGTEKDYGSHIRSLQYMATSNSDCMPTFIAFCGALPRMNDLKALTIDVRTHHASYLIYLLYNTPLATALAATNHGIKIPIKPFSCQSIRKLQSFTLHGPIRMLNIFANHSVTSLSISEPLDELDFDYLIDAACGWSDKTNNTLRKFVLTLDLEMATQMPLVLQKLDSAFPCLEELVIRAPNVEALKISEFFTKTPIILPHIRTFSLNDCTILPPKFNIKKETALNIQLVDVEKAGDLRGTLTMMSYGMIHWARESHYPKSKWSVVDHTASENVIVDEGYPFLFHDQPELWRVIY